jgi:predicted ThiF/HesA family dinucleotide-utilizing enzyme
VQISPGELLFRHVSDPLTTEDMDIIIKTTHAKLGEMKVSFIKETDIECSASGKYRWVENKLIAKQ